MTLVVLSIGFLAAGGLQLQALRDNQDAYHASQARLMLDDMMDSMRNNPAAVEDGAYDGKSTGAATATVEPGCVTNACTPSELAVRDLSEWSARLATGGATPPLLPPAEDGSAAVAQVSAPAGGVYTLTVLWGAVEGGVRAGRAEARFVP